MMKQKQKKKIVRVIPPKLITCPKEVSDSSLGSDDTFYTFTIKSKVRRGRIFFPLIKNVSELFCSTNFAQRFFRKSNDMTKLWKRIAIDNVMNFDESIKPESLRLLRVRIKIEDVTHELFDSRKQYDFHRKMAVIANLSDDEAKLLGHTRERALYKISRDPNRTTDDDALLDRLASQSREMDSLLGSIY